MTGSELFIPVRNTFSGKDPGFSELDKSLKRCFQAIEDWADSPFVSSAHIQNAAITNAHIADATIDAAKITNLSADKITSGTLNAEILLASKMRTGNAGSRRVELDAAGVRLHEDDDSVVVNLPTDTDQPAYFAGTVVASDLILSGSSTVSDQLTVDINGGIVNVAAAASDPASSPVVNTSTASTSFGVGASGTSRRGLYWDGSNYLFLTDGYLGATYAYLNVVNSAGVLQASHQVSWGSIYTAYGGWVRIGSLYYLLGARSKEASSDFYQIEVYEIVNGFLSRRGSQQLPTTYNATEVAHREGALTSDGTDLFAVVYNMNTGQFDVLRYTVSGYGMTHHSTVAHSIPASTSDVTAFYRGSGDLGGARNIFQIDGSTHYYVYNTSGVRQTSEEWDGQGFDGEGLTYRSGTFYEISTTEAKLYQYGSATGFASSTYWIAYTWYDADATGGTHESALSPRVPFTGAPRKALQVTWPTIPDGGGTDDPNSVRLYLKLATSDPGAAFGSYFRQGTTYADTTTTLLSYSTSTAGSQDTVFPNSGSPGQIVSGLGGFTVKGDGTLILPVFTSDPSGGVEGQIYFNSNTNKFTGYDGTSWVALH